MITSIIIIRKVLGKNRFGLMLRSGLILLLLLLKYDFCVCMCVSAQLHFNTCNEICVKLDNEQWYDHAPKIVKKSHEYKVTIVWNQQLTELFLAINWTL